MLPLAPQWLFQGSADLVGTLLSWFRSLSPLPAVLECLGQGDVGSHGMSADGGSILRYAVLAVATSLGCAVATIWRLDHMLLDRARPAGVMTEDRSALRAGRADFSSWSIHGGGRRGIGDWANPVTAKEFRSRRLGRSHWTLRLIALSAILSLVLSYLAAVGALGWGVEDIGGVLVLMQIAVLLLFAPSVAAGLISSERESGSWQLLRMTPLAPGRILRGKLFSVAWPLLLLLCATLPGYLVMMSVKPELVLQMRRVVASLALTAVFTVAVSAAASSFSRSTAAATTLSYLVLLAICLGPLLIWLGASAPFGPRTVEVCAAHEPRGRGPAGCRNAGVRHLPAVARQLVAHRQQQRGPACLADGADLAALPAGMSEVDRPAAARRRTLRNGTKLR